MRPTQSLKQARCLTVASWVERCKNFRPLSPSLEKPLCFNLRVVCGQLTRATPLLASSTGRPISLLGSSLLLAHDEIAAGNDYDYDYDEQGEDFTRREIAIHVGYVRCICCRPMCWRCLTFDLSGWP